MKLSAFLLCIVATMTQNTIFVLSDCLVGDIMYQEGDSIGHDGRTCCDDDSSPNGDSSSYIGVEGICGPDGEIIETGKTFTCAGSVPYCVQCGTPGEWGAALCLSDPAVPSNCEYNGETSLEMEKSKSSQKPLCSEVNTESYISNVNGESEGDIGSGSSNLWNMNLLFLLLGASATII